MPNGGDYEKFFGWTSIFNGSTHLPLSPVPAVTVASTIVTVTVTEIAIPAATDYDNAPPVESDQTQRPRYPKSSRSALFLETLADCLAQIILESATLYLYVGYNLLLLECAGMALYSSTMESACFKLQH